MASKPILFNTQMVQAILDGRKSMTRRAIKELPNDAEFTGWLLDSTSQEDAKDIGKVAFRTKETTEKAGCVFVRPLCQSDDILWVRETWCPMEKHFGVGTEPKYCYKADQTPESEQCRKDFGIPWHPSIHMPREAARIFLKVTNVRVERLQEIGGQGHHDDLFKEGVYQIGDSTGREMLQRFAELWNSTIKKKDIDTCGWEANPWVWVYEFERVSEDVRENP